VWWIVGGVLIAAAAVRWVARKHRAEPVLDHPGKVERAYEALRRGHPVAIEAAGEGPVLLRGTVSVAGAALVAPITGRPCVFFDMRVEDLLRGAGDRSPRPVSTAIRHKRHAQPFLVTDETGTAEVTFEDAADVSFVAEPHLALDGHRLRESESVLNVLKTLGIRRAEKIAVTEAAIFVGDTVDVVGVGTREVAPAGESAGYRDLPMRYAVRAGTNRVLAIRKRNV
jgi:hypothetical protein